MLRFTRALIQKLGAALGKFWKPFGWIYEKNRSLNLETLEFSDLWFGKRWGRPRAGQ